MRLGILLKDTEYRDALVDKLSSYDNNLFVNVLNGSEIDSSECLILTDIAPEDVDHDVFRKISDRTVFLTNNKPENDSGLYQYTDSDKERKCHKIFKYCSVADLVSEISVIYNEWQGRTFLRSYSAKIISVCTDTDAFSADKCLALARQIIYRRGGKVLLLSLGYINDYGGISTDRINRFAKLLYLVGSGRSDITDSFTCQDSYGISSLMLPRGRNPMAYLEEEELRSLINGLSVNFDSVILDINTCYRRENISLMRSSDIIICFESGRRVTGLEDITGNECSDKLIRIRLSGDTEEAFSLDDAVNEIFGAGKDGNNKSLYDGKIRN